MGVYCTTAVPGVQYGASNLLWGLLRQALESLGAANLQMLDRAGTYVPSGVAAGWGQVLFDRASELTVLVRPSAGRPGQYRPLLAYRFEQPHGLFARRAEDPYALLGERLSMFGSELGPLALAFAAFLSSSGGFTTTRRRPLEPGTRALAG